MPFPGETEWILLNMRESFEEDVFEPGEDLVAEAEETGITLGESYRRRRLTVRLDRQMKQQVSVSGLTTPTYGIGFTFNDISDLEAYVGNLPGFYDVGALEGKVILVDRTREYDNDNGHDILVTTESWELRSPKVQFFVDGKWSVEYNEETQEEV